MARRACTIFPAAIVSAIVLTAQAAMLLMPSAQQIANASVAPVPRFDQKLEWPLVRLHANALWRTTEGHGATVAVVDTGIYAGQQDLADVVVKTIDLVGNPKNGIADEAHGTAVAGLIAGRGSPVDPEQVAGLAPEAALIDVRVATKPGSVTPAEIAAGISAAAQAGAQVINVSLGSSTPSPQLQQAVTTAQTDGCLIVASAGDTGTPEYPAHYPGVLAVGEADRDSRPLASMTAFGPDAIYAPGSDLYSTAVPPHTGAPAGYFRNLHGSDFATAFVSAAAALLLSADPRLKPQDIRRFLLQSAYLNGLSGAGNLDPLAALGQLHASAPPPIPLPPNQAVTGHSSVKLLLLTVAVLLFLLLAVGGFRIYKARVADAPSSWDEPW
jgi:subtilisin family serine protease